MSAETGVVTATVRHPDGRVEVWTAAFLDRGLDTSLGTLTILGERWRCDELDIGTDTGGQP